MANYVFFAATSSISMKCIEIMANKGDNLVLVARNKEGLDELSDRYDCPNIVCDSTNFQSVMTTFEKAKAMLGSLDGAVNFTGSFLETPIEQVTQEQWDEALKVNLDSAFAVVQASIKMLKEVGGSVVLFSTAEAQIGVANREVISAAKAGVEGLMRSVAASYAKSDIRFNCVAPGLIDTKMMQSGVDRQAHLKMQPLERMGEVKDAANVVSFLLDPQNSFITGQTIVVDGGLSGLK